MSKETVPLSLPNNTAECEHSKDLVDELIVDTSLTCESAPGEAVATEVVATEVTEVMEVVAQEQDVKAQNLQKRQWGEFALVDIFCFAYNRISYIYSLADSRN